MKKEFVTYPLALRMKQLGFNEPCFGYYLEDGEWQPASYSYNGTVYPSNKDLLLLWVSAPLFQQAFRWFRDKHNIDAWVQPFMMEKHGTAFLPDESYGYWIFKDGVLVADEVDFLNPEEAELACLKKLIEIIKDK